MTKVTSSSITPRPTVFPTHPGPVALKPSFSAASGSVISTWPALTSNAVSGALVYNEDFPNDADLSAGEWSYEVPFDVQSVVPAATYYISVIGYGDNDDQLNQIDN